MTNSPLVVKFVEAIVVLPLFSAIDPLVKSSSLTVRASADVGQTHSADSNATVAVIPRDA